MNISRGMFAVVLGFGLLAAAHATNRYVSLSGTNDSANGYTNWAGAATNIQYAISACSSGDVVWVTNGIYDVGGVTNWPSGSLLTNRVAITTAYVTVRSFNNDPVNTIIKGAWDPDTNGPAAVRCVYMDNNTTLIGFTLMNGSTLTSGEFAGGGLRGYSSTGQTVSNCVIIGNRGIRYGGGAFNGGKLYNCTLADNGGTTCWGGGARDCTLYNCLIVSNFAAYGGGTYKCTLYNCMVMYNRSTGYGGGTSQGNVYNCLITANYTPNYGGGSYGGNVYNTTIVGNYASDGGAAGGTYINCIIYDNYNNKNLSDTYSEYLTNSCTWPIQANWVVGDGNITNNPIFVADGRGYGVTNIPGDYHLRVDSPCVNAGMNLAWMTNAPDPCSKDLDGQRRIQYGTVDMGAYERLNRGIIFNAH